MAEAGYVANNLAIGKVIDAAKLFPGSIDDINDGRCYLGIRIEDSTHAEDAPALDLHRLGMADLCVGIAEIQGKTRVFLE